MQKKSTSQSGIFNPRVLVAFALCSFGVLLGMFSLAATSPGETTRANTSVPADPRNFPSTVGSNANRLPPGVPMPPGAQFSPNGQQRDPSSSSPAAGFPGFGGMPPGLDAPPGRKPFRPGTASDANSLGNPVFANQQPSPLSGQQPAASESMPLASAAAGAWAIVSSPNTSTTQSNYLWDVTCVSASDCWAVGDYAVIAGGTTINHQTLIEHWDGISWAIVSSPNTSSVSDTYLYGVTCVSGSDCWAVGYEYVGGLAPASAVAQALIEHWDGTSWAIVVALNPNGVQETYLRAVTCVSASNCWAVGYYLGPNGYLTFIEQWNGTAWAIAPSPNGNIAANNVLLGVSCVSVSDCWAAGDYQTGGHFQTLIEHWDGTSWGAMPFSSPNTSTTQDNYFLRMTCASASECWAVGFVDDNNIAHNLIERWNGTSWAIVSSPNSSATKTNVLYGVTCASASECWAVGFYVVDTNPYAGHNLIERWDGVSWAIVSSPDISKAITLTGVTCRSASDCWAVGVGSNTTTGQYQTLTEHYTVPPLPTSVVSRMTHGSITMPPFFDIDLPLPVGTSPRGVECRSSASLGAGNYTLVFTFPNNLTSVTSASVTAHDPTSGTGTVSSSAIGPNPNQYTVNLTGVSTGQYLTVTLNSVLDATGASGNILSPQMGVLVGDVNASGVVTSGDTNLCKGQALQPVTTANFRDDINASGAITTGDVNIIKQNALHQLPSPP